MRILADTNLLVRVRDVTSSQHQVAQQALTDLLGRGHSVCLCAQILAEFWAVATRPLQANGLGAPVNRVRSWIDQSLGEFALLDEPADAVTRWLELVTRYAVVDKPTHDARLVALMIERGVTHLLTFNSGDFTRYQEIGVVDPADPGTFPAPAV